MTLNGKAALVTGSATGIGRSTAIALARRGCNRWPTARPPFKPCWAKALLGNWGPIAASPV